LFTPVPACNLILLGLPCLLSGEVNMFMNPQEQFAIPSATPPSGGRRKPALFTTSPGQNVEADGPPATDPNHVLGSIRAGDVVLVAGRTRMSRFIRFLSGSPWTHVALCVGRLEEYTQNADPALRDPNLRDLIAGASHGDAKEPVLIGGAPGPRNRPHPPQALPCPRREDLSSTQPLRAAGGPGDPLCGPVSGF
jgi:hypothetical protein